MLKDALPNVKMSLPGPNAARFLKQRKEVMPDAIASVYPCVIKRGEGAMVEDVDGNIFLDWIGGVGVLNIGYSHKEIIEAVKTQADQYFHAMMNIITHEGYLNLAEKMNEIVPVKEKIRKTMFANSGAEAIENAVKIAKSYTKRPNIIVFSGAFHGRTLLAATMTAKKSYATGIGPFPDGIYRGEFPYLYRGPKGYSKEALIDYYIEKLHKLFDEVSSPDQIAAIVLEPVQGEGGFVPAPMEWVQAIRKLCDDKGILLVADEVQTGFARSGKMFVSHYWEEAGCAPDILVSAKSIAAGIPLSAVTAGASIMDGVTKGVIGGTYGGNALACAAAQKVIQIIEETKLCERSLVIAKKCRTAFEEFLNTFEEVGDVRGIGCMLGIEFVTDKESKTPNAALVTDIIAYCIGKGLLIESAGTYSNVIRFLSPLVVTDAQIDRGLEILKDGIAYCTATRKAGKV